MMIWVPFICLAIGIVIGLQKLPSFVLKVFDFVTNAALILLLLVIGANIGSDETVMGNLPVMGVNCVIIALTVIFFSVVLTFVAEKTVLPLERIHTELQKQNISLNSMIPHEADADGKTDVTGNGAGEEKKNVSLVWIMPTSIVAGILYGFYFMPGQYRFILDYGLIGALVILYVSVGVSQGANKTVFQYVRVLGVKIILLPVAIFAGSVIGGFVAGAVLQLPMYISVIAASGMSFYSITGAYMTQNFGIEAGTYGFVVNVMREFFTILFMPFLVKISKGSPIAGGAAGNMDTMLAPVTKFVGAELGLVTLLTGTLLTLAVPFLLPVWNSIFRML
jgi:uncharacterized membrane protein YbjE (DUF340 family)